MTTVRVIHDFRLPLRCETLLFWDVTQRKLAVSYRRFLDSLTIADGTDRLFLNFTYPESEDPNGNSLCA